MLRRNVSFYLPVVQVALAGLLMSVDPMRHGPGKEPWLVPERQICYGMNAPAAFVGAMLTKCEVGISPLFLFNYLEHLFFTYVLYLILVGATWYAVAFEISRTGSIGSSITPLTRIRGIADLALVACGGVLMFVGMMAVMSVRHVGWGRWEAVFFGVSWLLWGLILVSFYGRHLYLCTLGTRHSSRG